MIEMSVPTRVGCSRTSVCAINAAERRADDVGGLDVECIQDARHVGRDVVRLLVLTLVSTAVLWRVVRLNEPDRGRIISMYGLLLLLPPIVVFLPLMSRDWRPCTCAASFFRSGRWTRGSRPYARCSRPEIVPVRSGE
jgi:hypothetical protein